MLFSDTRPLYRLLRSFVVAFVTGRHGEHYKPETCITKRRTELNNHCQGRLKTQFYRETIAVYFGDKQVWFGDKIEGSVGLQETNFFC